MTCAGSEDCFFTIDWEQLAEKGTATTADVSLEAGANRNMGQSKLSADAKASMSKEKYAVTSFKKSG